MSEDIYEGKKTISGTVILISENEKLVAFYLRMDGFYNNYCLQKFVITREEFRKLNGINRPKDMLDGKVTLSGVKINGMKTFTCFDDWQITKNKDNN